MPTVDLPHGTLHYHEAGSGAPIVFLHGYLMGANLWDPVVRRLAGEFRCVTPELPFGAHPTPMRPDADLTTAGLGRLAADFLQALDLPAQAVPPADRRRPRGRAHPHVGDPQGQAGTFSAQRLRLAEPPPAAA